MKGATAVEEEKKMWAGQYKVEAEGWGDVAVRAVLEGDLGQARSAARRAANYAKLAIELENPQE